MTTPSNDKKDARHPTATAPDSVEESVYEEADFVGREGPRASDPPTAEKKSDSDTEPAEPQASGLDPEESADVFETREEAERVKDAREDDDDRQDEDIISLDTSD